MKKLVLSCLLAVGSFTATAQYFDYTTTAGWSANIRNLYTAPSGCPLAPLGSLASAGTINITGGVVDCRAVRGAHENRISTALGNFYDKEFILDFDFNMAGTGSFNGKSIYPAVLTSKDLSPEFALPMVTCAAAPDMDLLGVRLLTPGGNSNANPGAYIVIYDNGVNISPTSFIPISYATTYYARMQVYANQHGELLLYSDAARTLLVGSFCFEIPESVNGLNILQHSTSPGAGTARVTTAWVDNTNVYKTVFDCCRIDIKGPNVISGSSTAAVYTIYGVKDPVTYIEPGDVIYSLSADGQIFVSSWGEIPDSGPKVVKITVTGICQCVEIRTTMLVYVYRGRTRSAQVEDGSQQPGTGQLPAVRIFPNPSSGMVSVEHDEDIKSIVLVDATGKVLEEIIVKDARAASVNLSSRPAGLYSLRIVTASGTQVEQVIKK